MVSHETSERERKKSFTLLTPLFFTSHLRHLSLASGSVKCTRALVQNTYNVHSPLCSPCGVLFHSGGFSLSLKNEHNCQLTYPCLKEGEKSEKKIVKVAPKNFKGFNYYFSPVPKKLFLPCPVCVETIITLFGQKDIYNKHLFGESVQFGIQSGKGNAWCGVHMNPLQLLLPEKKYRSLLEIMYVFHGEWRHTSVEEKWRWVQTRPDSRLTAQAVLAILYISFSWEMGLYTKIFDAKVLLADDVRRKGNHWQGASLKCNGRRVQKIYKLNCFSLTLLILTTENWIPKLIKKYFVLWLNMITYSNYWN